MSATRQKKHTETGHWWIPRIPSHWEIVPFKRLVDIRNGRDHKEIEQETGYPVLGSGGVFAHASDFLYDGEVVLLGRKGTVDRPLHFKGRFWAVDTMYWGKIRNGVNGRFAYYSAQTIPFDYYKTNTALPSMTKSILGAHRVCLPPLIEQTAIAHFLDRETARIDALVEKKRLLVSKQQDRLSSLLQSAVIGSATINRGLDQNWLENLPDSWGFIPLKHLVRVKGGATPSKDTISYWTGDIPWVSPKDMKVDLISDVPDHVSEPAVLNSALQMIPAEAVLIVVRGMILARHVPICMLAVEGTINQDMKALIARKSLISPQYLQRMLQGFSDVLLSYIDQAAHGTKKLRSEALFSLKFPVPPRETQDLIVQKYEAERIKTGLLVSQVENSINLLTELRASLITAAVTGQIDPITDRRHGSTNRALEKIEAEMAQ
jgi:type I restriction enzyme S subunit